MVCRDNIASCGAVSVLCGCITTGACLDICKKCGSCDGCMGRRSTLRNSRESHEGVLRHERLVASCSEARVLQGSSSGLLKGFRFDVPRLT